MGVRPGLHAAGEGQAVGVGARGGGGTGHARRRGFSGDPRRRAGVSQLALQEGHCAHNCFGPVSSGVDDKGADDKGATEREREGERGVAQRLTPLSQVLFILISSGLAKYFTASILTGLLVSFLFIIIASGAFSAMMGISPPNRSVAPLYP